MANSPTPSSTAPTWVPTAHLTTRLYHGCLRSAAAAMLGGNVDPLLGQPDSDFGRGFYTTTLRRQAADWAYLRYKLVPRARRGAPGNQPVVIRFDVPRVDLATLDTLNFVRGDYAADEYWGFVQHCRASVRATAATQAIVMHHTRDASAMASWYDLVCGPVAAFWQQKSAMLDSDQYSFHTPKGADVLNEILRAGTRSVDYDVEVA